MYSIGEIVTVLTSAALQTAATIEFEDFYRRMRKRLLALCPRLSLDRLEKNPDSESVKSMIADELASSGAANDARFQEEIRGLISKLENIRPPAKGVSIEDTFLDGGDVTTEDIDSTGDGFTARRLIIRNGGIRVGSVRAGLDVKKSDKPDQLDA
jgi:hypothetical protein